MRVTRYRGTILLALLLLLWAGGGYAFYRIDRWHDERDYPFLAELIAYKAELAKAIPGPRIVIAGGSNAYYGIDSDILERNLDRPVVNLALPFGAHHFRINLALLEDMIQPGDVVVYAAAGFWHGPTGVRRRAVGFDSYLVDVEGIEYERQFDDTGLPWKILPSTNTLMLALVDRAFPKPGRPWVADTDKHGDFTGCIPLPVIEPERYGGQNPNRRLARVLRTLAQRLDAKGAQLVVHMPWLLIQDYERDEWIAFMKRFAALYEPVVPVIATDPRSTLNTDRAAFCDSPFHLSVEKTRERSIALVAALKPYLTSRIASGR